MRMSRTWDSTMSMIPRGGNTIWGDLDWSPEEGNSCARKREKKNETQIADQAGSENAVCKAKSANYGRIISFGQDVAESPSADIERIDFRVIRFSFNLGGSPVSLFAQVQVQVHVT